MVAYVNIEYVSKALRGDKSIVLDLARRHGRQLGLVPRRRVRLLAARHGRAAAAVVAKLMATRAAFSFVISTARGASCSGAPEPAASADRPQWDSKKAAKRRARPSP